MSRCKNAGSVGVGERPLSYFLKYVQAASANKTTAVIQSDESLIPVFLAMVQH
jgi:hypothetical protein